MKILRGQKLNLNKVDAVVVPVFESATISPIITAYPEADFFMQKHKFKGKAGESIAFYSAHYKNFIVIIGVGRPGCLSDTVKCSKQIISILKQNKTKKAVIHFLQNLKKLGIKHFFWVNFIDYLFLNHYSFETYKSNKDKTEILEKISLYFDEPNSSTYLPLSLFKERGIINQSVNLARDLINDIPSRVNPDYMVEEFYRVAQEYQLDILVLRDKELRDHSLNGILAVGAASPFESALIRLSYIPDESIMSLALVGKGITFDSGGLTLKSRSSMSGMKSDMSGAAAILGIMAAVAKLGPPVIIDAFAPIAENMPGKYAFKPGDIVTFSNKKTVEIVDTDAEGRLLLADALIMAAEENPDCIVEMSTLTGAIINALGDGMAGIMGNNERLVSMLLEAGENSGDRLWQLPLPEDYKESLGSRMADLKNAGYGRASSIKAGLFLNEFIKNIPFAHIDIAGTAFLLRSNPFFSQEGATGFGVRLIIEFLKIWGKNKKKFDKNIF